ncbi:DNA-binding transcriptional ArsR family regulator [Methanolinea mesophila]|uniref:helix-turn-helix domain-containing protein n=1 Tax=Methanolinea mesophila TaxID=547055 RepID=UPI001AE5E2DF|nr:helix-turn-helix domain-containing protein [Methanolinea mesophila]MBP1929653.1 DNA-binding transcriptional ArsR family regulator [Methanolinea mesophila]
MTSPRVHWPVLAAILVLFLVAPVLAGGGSAGGGNSGPGEDVAGAGSQSIEGADSQGSYGSPVSGDAVSVGQGGSRDEGAFSRNSDAVPQGPAGGADEGEVSAPSSVASAWSGQTEYSGSTAEAAPAPAGTGQGGSSEGLPTIDGSATGSGRNPGFTGISGGYGDNPAGTGQVARVPQQGAQGSARSPEGPQGMDPAGEKGAATEGSGARGQARAGDAGTGGAGLSGAESRASAGRSPESGFTPGWSYSLEGTITDGEAYARDIPRGPSETKGRGPGGMNGGPAVPPGHVPYGEVPFGHIPYGPNPAGTVMSPAPQAQEDQRRTPRPRSWQHATIETTGDTPAVPAAFPLVFPPLIPLGYRRIFGKNVLANPSRKRIYDHICQHPGTDLNGVTGACGMNRETTRYHLRQLASSHKITVLSADGNTRYFQNHGLFSRRDQMVIHHLEKGTSGEILRYVATHHGATRQDIAEYLGIAGPTVSRHLATLVREGLIVTRKEGKFLRCELGADVCIPGSPLRLEFPEHLQGACSGS